MTEKGTRVLYGDSQSGIQVIFNPNGPWRSRHLRLRSRALHEAVQQEVWKVKHMAGVELAADFLTKPITVGATWSRFRRFAGLYDMAEPEDLEILKKIGICREWALKGLTVAVELEKWKPTTEEHHRIRKLGIRAVATGVCHVVQKWKSHLCCLKRKSRTPRENEPGIGTQSTETRWPRENEPGPNHQMLRENEPSIKKTLQPQGPTSFGEFDFGKSFFGDSVVGGTCDNNLSGEGAQVFNSGMTAAGFGNHCPLGCPRVRALRAEAMATSVADAGGGGGDGPGDGGDDRKPWNQSSMYDDTYTGEKKKRKRKKKKNQAAKADPGEEKGPETEACDEEKKEDEWPSWENQALAESEETLEEEPRPVTLMRATSKSAPSAAPRPAPLPPQDDAPAGEEGSTATGSRPTPPQGPEHPGGATYTVRGFGHRDVESGFFWEGERVVVSFVNEDGDLNSPR